LLAGLGLVPEAEKERRVKGNGKGEGRGGEFTLRVNLGSDFNRV